VVVGGWQSKKNKTSLSEKQEMILRGEGMIKRVFRAFRLQGWTTKRGVKKDLRRSTGLVAQGGVRSDLIKRGGKYFRW